MGGGKGREVGNEKREGEEERGKRLVGKGFFLIFHNLLSYLFPFLSLPPPFPFSLVPRNRRIDSLSSH